MPKFACPSCQKALKTSAQVPAGKKIKCPECSHVFRLPALAEVSEERVAKRVTVPPDTPRPSTRKVIKEAPADDESDSQDKPAPRKSKKKAAKNKNMPLILAGVAAVLGLLAVTAFVWPGFLVGGSSKAKAVASAPKNTRAPRPMPEKKDNPEAQPEVLHQPAPANEGDAPGKPKADDAKADDAKATDAKASGAKAASPEGMSIRAVMGKLARGPQGLQNQVGNELKNNSPPWETLQAQSTEYVTLVSALAKNEPRRGSKESWAKLTATFAESATALDRSVQSKNRDAALAAHSALANACMACHQQHKGR
jgi:hypothetical protein